MKKFSHVQGLTDREVIESRRLHGANEVPTPKTETFFEKLKEKFQEPLIKILCVALAITMGLAIFGYADWKEGLGIAVSVFIATFVATYSEFKNEASFQELQEEANRIETSVFRNKKLQTIDIAQVVVGDCVLLQAGARIPADGRILIGEIEVDQSSLNGEREPFKKTAAPPDYKQPLEFDFMDPHRVFRGAVVEEGEAVMLVDLVGAGTVHGKLAQAVAEDDDRPPAPLQAKLAQLAAGISRLGYMGSVLISLSFMFKQLVLNNHSSWPKMVEYCHNVPVFLHDVVTSIVLAIIIVVVAVPEGLPMMIAVVLSLNMRKLLKVAVLVRRLMGIETAGCLEILFADKTGTLTVGNFEPEGFLTVKGDLQTRVGEIPEELRSLLSFAIRTCNSAVATPQPDKSISIVGGNATDRALLRFLEDAAFNEDLEFTLEGEVLFNSAHKFAAVQVNIAAPQVPPAWMSSADVVSRSTTLLKGAPEMILDQCDRYYDEGGIQRALTDEVKASLIGRVNALSARGTRLIAVSTSCVPAAALATKKAVEFDSTNPDHTMPASDEIAVEIFTPNKGKRRYEQTVYELPSKMTLIGIIGVRDRIRSTAKESVRIAKRAGVHVVMVTGDRKETAVAVAKEIGLLEDSDNENDAVIVSSDLQKLSPGELGNALLNLKVVARALPSDKSRLVSAAKQQGRVCGMTGDGVNDSAALRKADVSFAMASGAEVAKEVSDIVILDDNFESIMQAVLYGRTIFKSIRKFIVFQSTINLASSVIVFVGPFMGFDFPLTLIQLLWLNIVMDTFAGIAFGGEPALPQYMQERPISRSESIIDQQMWESILGNGGFMALYSILFLNWHPILNRFSRVASHVTEHLEEIDLHAKHEGVKEIKQQGGPVFLTAFFCFFIFLCAFNAFNVRTSELNIAKNISRNRGFVLIMTLIFVIQILFVQFGGHVLRTVPLTTNELVTLLFMASLIIPVDMLRKLCGPRLFHPGTKRKQRVLQRIAGIKIEGVMGTKHS